MATWTLADIRNGVRQVIGRLSSDELTNQQLDDRINQFYQFMLPAELKLESKLQLLELDTVANQVKYDLPSGFTNPVVPGRLNNLNLIWYQDPIRFRDQNPYNVSTQTTTGDGVTAVFNFTTQSFPLIPGSVRVTDNTEIFDDDENGILTGNLGGSGTVNYATGAITVTFATAPDNGQTIYYSYKQYQPGRPVAVLWFDDQFEFYPIPDQTYRFTCQAYATVSPLVNATDTPDFQQWGPFIVYGASRLIHALNAEYDAYANVTVLYEEQLHEVMRRTHQNLLNDRAAPNF